MYKLVWNKQFNCLDVELDDRSSLLSSFLQSDMMYILDAFKDVINHIEKAVINKEKNLTWGGNATFTEFTEKECIIEELFSEDDDEKCVIDILEFREIVIAWFEEMTKIKYKQGKISKEKYDEIMAVVKGYKK